MTENEEYALRIANGEKLTDILDEVRDEAFKNGVAWAENVLDDEEASNSVGVQAGGEDD